MAGLKKTRQELIDKAWELGIEYEKRYAGCCQATFLAIVDALREGGLDIFPKEMEEEFYSAICLLSAGVGLTGEGTCGAVSGGVMAIGAALNIPMDNPEMMERGGGIVKQTLLKKYFDTYGSMLCKDVQRKYFGKAWDLMNEEATKEFLSITDGCVIRQTAAWVTGIILDEIENGNIKLRA
jgi:hypothetical protein